MDVIERTPLLWVLLIALAGLTLLTGVLPRRGANLAAALVVVLAAIALARGGFAGIGLQAIHQA